ncbi:hypothetical protein [Streptomyces sp. NPDC058653]|uniref:hypothetical protein n=1 Tax=Streptomyces sp. NPDC058653 TaxID=3346576 RepID=UPI00365EDB7A
MSTEAETSNMGDLAGQLRRRREAAARCEPLACGHRDPENCVDTCAEPRRDETRDEIHVEPDDIVGLWADAKSLYLANDFPPYGSSAWIALGPDDPRRIAAALDAAEKWRLYGDDVTEWLQQLPATQGPVWCVATRAQLDQAAKPKPTHQLRATPGWPPVRVPGQPQQYLTNDTARRVA